MIKNDLGTKAFFKSFRIVLRYLTENWIISKVSKAMSEDSFKLIRYEDLALDPEKAMKDVSDWLKIKKDWSFEDFREKENHGIAGNKMRFGLKGIVLDEKWKKSLNPFIKNVVTVLTYFSAKKYGHFRK